jgi:hypothetical protein
MNVHQPIILVDVDLIHVEQFHSTVTTYLHYNMHIFTIHALILNTPASTIH